MKIKDMPVDKYRRMCQIMDEELAYTVDFIVECEGWDTLKDMTQKEFVEFCVWYDHEKWDFGERICALQDAGKDIMEIYNNYYNLCDVEFYDYEMGDEYPDNMDDLVKRGCFADVGWAYVCLVA